MSRRNQKLHLRQFGGQEIWQTLSIKYKHTYDSNGLFVYLLRASFACSGSTRHLRQLGLVKASLARSACWWIFCLTGRPGQRSSTSLRLLPWAGLLEAVAQQDVLLRLRLTPIIGDPCVRMGKRAGPEKPDRNMLCPVLQCANAIL